MKRTSQSGVALVITLIMLSVITLLAVAFLSSTRRERTSVTVTSAQIDAKLMADAALSRAIAEEMNRMVTMGSVLNYDLIVSTNQDGRTNVQFPMALNDVASATVDPRVPVYTTNLVGGVGVTNFPFWLDFNRNTIFDPATNGTTNGMLAGDPQWIGVLADPSTNHSRANRMIGRYAFLALPTGKSLDVNFAGNYAKHLVNNMPSDGYLRNQGVGTWEFNLAGFLNELNSDAPGFHGWNYVNYRTNLTSGSGSGLTNDAFISAHEIVRYRYGGTNNNLASFTNMYPGTGAGLFGSDNLDGYTDGPIMIGASLLANETLATPFLPDNPALPWPGAANPNVIGDMQDLVNVNFRSRYPTFQDQLRSAMAPVNTNQLDRNTFYRMLAQMGVDSALHPSQQTVRSLVSTNLEATARAVAHGLANGDYVEIRGATPADYNGVYPVRILNGNVFQYTFGGTQPVIDTPASGVVTMRRVKINLNFDNIVQTNPVSGLATATNFYAWKPVDFFRVVADRLIQLSITNDGGTPRRWFIGGQEVSPTLSITNIQLYPTNEYGSSLHRLLQLAANLYDATTNTADGTVMPAAGPGFPSVFQPIVSKGSGPTVSVVGYREVTNSLPVTNVFNRFIYDIGDFASNGIPPGVYTDRILYGVPLVIGAKKGYPNFNEFAFLLAAQGLRKVQLVRSNPAQLPDKTNVMFMLSISNQIGMEIWNSYSNGFPRDLNMYAQVSNRFVLTNDLYPGYVTNGGTNIVRNGTYVANSITSWPSPQSFIFPLGQLSATNLDSTLANSVFRVSPSGFVLAPDRTTTNGFEQAGLVEPQFWLHVSNRVFFAMVDKAADRIVDFVAMSGFSFNTNLSAGFAEENPAGGQAGTTYPGKLLWDTTRASGSGGPTQGLEYQLQVSSDGGADPIAPYRWENYPLVGVKDKETSRKNFTAFRQSPNAITNQLWGQAGYQAVGECARAFLWQVNDPLVHYMVDDFVNPFAGPGDYRSERYPIWLNPQFFIAQGTPLRGTYTLATPQNVWSNYGSMGFVNARYKAWRDDKTPAGTPTNTLGTYYQNLTLQDPQVTRSDKWDFPQGKFGNIGWIGRVHRGTPWQTVYLKSTGATNEDWHNWVGRDDLNPTNDWRLPDIFTAAIDPTSARGLLSINQSNSAAWAAALAGVNVLSNTADWYIDPGTPQFRSIFNGIQTVRTNLRSQVFTNISQLLAVPELSVASPFTDPVTNNEVAMERIPQQVLSLLTVEEVPRITVYAWGQSLKPARQSLFTGGGTNFQLCTNYQVTGEVVTRTVLRIEGNTNAPRAVVESYNVLSAP